MGDESPRVQEGLQVGVSELPGPWAAQCPVSLGLTVTQLPALFFPVHFWRGHTRIKYKEPVESCPMHSVRCDGVADCKLKSDELGCGKQAGHRCVCAHARVCRRTTVTTNSNGRQRTENWRIWVLVTERLCLKLGFECCETWANHLPSLGSSFLIYKMNGLDKLSGS